MPSSTVTRPHRPLDRFDRDLAALRRIGALPPAQPSVVVPTKALGGPSPATGAIVAHLDPGQLRAPGGIATVYSYGPSRVDSAVGDFAVFGGAGFIAPVLHLELWDQPNGTDVVATIRISISGENAVKFTATGNPVPMLLSGGVSGGAIVTVHVPMTASAGYCAAILEPQPASGGGFAFWSADFRLF